MKTLKIVLISVALALNIYATPTVNDNGEARGLQVQTSVKNTEQRIALIIGNNQYQGRLTKLDNPINDARAIKEILEQRDFHVIYVENASKKSIKKSLNKFYTKIKNGGVGMFYFSGHGIEVDGQNYLIPTDAKIEAKSDTEYEAIALNKITKRMQNIGNRLNIVVLDACRNDPFSRAIGTGGLAKVEPIGMFVSFSTGAGSVASDGGSGGNGLFTKSLVKYMKQELDLRDVFQKTRQEVYQASNHKQFPAIYDQTINGKFYFTPPRGIKYESQSPTPPPISVQSIKREEPKINPNHLKVYVSKVSIAPTLTDKINVNNSSHNYNDLIEIIFEVENNTPRNIHVNYRVKWFNNEGFEVGETLSVWQPIFIDANENKKMKEISPMPTASSYKLYFK